MHITRLKLLGFKSFVEQTDLVVEPGLTGVVGPNGCGKSNLLEALRWVMGETSIKNMRASAMDDVVFSGTNLRPRRETAEVSIVLDNAKRQAPAAFNDSDILEVSRKISREAGSQYKINGADVRARDVQLLFADASTGARSPALVQQGRIGEIVNSKPQARRRILEEAAGITGLYSRRHEAELRLKAAEGNLERLDDVMGQIGSQLSGLKRQARQARRYREISSLIQQTQAVQFHLSWQDAVTAVDQGESSLQEAMTQVGLLTQQESEAIRAQAGAAESLMPLRNEEATRAAVLHRMEMERERLDRDEEQILSRQKELSSLLEQLEKDLKREEEQIEEAALMSARLSEEESELEEAVKSAGNLDELKQKADDAREELDQLENSFSSVTEQSAEARARHDQLKKVVSEQDETITRLAKKAETMGDDLAAAEKDVPSMDEADRLRPEIERLAASVVWLEEKTLEDEKLLQEAETKEAEVREQVRAQEIETRQLEREVETLTKVLKPSAEASWTPVVDQLKVQEGYEAALGAALGDDLEASVSSDAPARWDIVEGATVLPPLPFGTKSLSEFVSGPEALTRRLQMVAVLEYGDGAQLQQSLGPGQRLVSMDGDLWRWDGFCVDASAPTPAAVRLSERNRLIGLEKQRDEAKESLDRLEEELRLAQTAASEKREQEKSLRVDWRELQSKLGAARDRVAQIEHLAHSAATKVAGLREAQEQVTFALGEAEEAKTRAEYELGSLPPVEKLESEQSELSSKLTEVRARYNEAQSVYAEFEREARSREQRLKAVSEDVVRWRNRRSGSDTQIKMLKDRLSDANTELSSFEGKPEKIAEDRQKLLTELSRTEQSRQEAADKLAEAETLAKTTDKTLRDLVGVLSTAREERARVEAKLEAARERRDEQARLIREAFGCAPEDCLALSGVDRDQVLPELTQVESDLIKLKADRDRLGGVNLRAEEEVAEVEAQFDGIEKEKADLEEAIAKLRQGVAALNREGRKRLLEAFDEVNAHFKRLFTVLFGGGDAELQLIESDDPLEAGLEIMARPPGKKPQVLTLLSGGEKALTALSLIFAVFLTNPSPICVLDEVDAPLDDANVERFCTMMEEMRDSTDTRFLVITHHPTTMARMNRLFGVTMAEKGVSQLVSVDLATAEGFREAS